MESAQHQDLTCQCGYLLNTKNLSAFDRLRRWAQLAAAVIVMKLIRRSILVGLLIAFYVVAKGEAHATSSLFMEASGKANAPIGHVAYCKSNPKSCSKERGHNRAMFLTQDRWNELLRVNDLVNRSVLPVSDETLYSQIEHWALPGRYGDCEDYVLLKQQYLQQAGWPAGSVLITVVRDEYGEGHAVLTVRTDRGDFILDNQSTLIKHWSEVPYTFIKRQSVYHAAKWQDINDTREEVLTTATTH